MITRALARLHHPYSQSPLPPPILSQLLRSSLPSLPLPQLLHTLHLYNHNITIFDVDYYQQASHYLIGYQKRLSVGDIVAVLGLGVRYGVRNQMVWRHMEAELYHRLHGVMWNVIEGEMKADQEKLKRVMQGWEKGNGDLYGILTQEFLDEQKKLQQSTTPTNPQNPPTKSIKPTSSKSTTPTLPSKKPQILQNLYSFTDILIWYGCTNTPFLTLLLQSQLHPSLAPSSPGPLLRLCQLLVYTLQTLLKQYQDNKSQYTARSIKSIYKYQSCYLPPIIKHMQQLLPSFSDGQIKHLTQVMGSFPIKKRANRTALVYSIKNEWQRRGVQLGDGVLEGLLGGDEKLVGAYRRDYGLGEGQGKVGAGKEENVGDEEEDEEEGHENKLGKEDKKVSQQGQK